MIDRREILESAFRVLSAPGIVEKDCVLGWLLARIFAHHELVDSWVFKGGTCLKKCFFETYRLFEDLDFTLRDEAHLEDGLLRRVLGEVIAWFDDESGLAMPADQVTFDIYASPHGRLSCQGKIGYRGPASPTSKRWWLAEGQARPHSRERLWSWDAAENAVAQVRLGTYECRRSDLTSHQQHCRNGGVCDGIVARSLR